ncbi:CU044_5270 family protein [Streptomyces sp. DSM 40750]|uniref:CU044_5270 family protein n=1 Tax=Streptomyces sp. DSM 40750 TaxID=2801030 RepID=UPI00214B04A5|nr:CU044_5270 family protein [Streptomyces sp. DSM 40750]UUU24207.1 CU044_5270 family protein [Streptomyces sp. DSM 40750]
MNDNPSPQGVPSSPGIPPAEDRDLPPGRHHALREHLMREIESGAEGRDTDRAEGPGARPLWRRPAFVAPAVAAALTAAVVVGAAVTQDAAVPPRTGTDSATAPARSAADLLERIARAAEKRPGPGPVRDDQFVYIKSTEDAVDATFDDTCVVQRVTLYDFESWTSVDGTLWGLDRSYENGRKTYEEKQHPKSKSSGAKAPMNYRAVRELPTDPEAMYKWLHTGRNARSRTDDSAFQTAGEILSENLVPPEVSAALFRAVAELPGVTAEFGVEDALGRGGIAIGRTPDEDRTERIEWIFDEETLEYLGERRVRVAPSGEDAGDEAGDGAGDDAGQGAERGGSTCPPVKDGTVLMSKAITEQAVVDKTGELP